VYGSDGLIITVSWWVVEVYKICTAYFSQVMHFFVTWLCAVRRGKWTGHPNPFNSWLSTPRGGGIMCIYECVPACAWVCGYAHLVPALYEDPSSLRADNCTCMHACIHTYIHTYIHTDRQTDRHGSDGAWISFQLVGTLGRTWSRWEDNINAYLKRIGYEDMHWIQLVQERLLWTR
jgi:hypothetical protein